MPQTAADQVLTELRAINGDGGVIFAGHDGCSGWSFNTPSMLRGRLIEVVPENWTGC
jgi:isoaspartyl peptidase/L-asparaginase-like protein (Ntn-hydrolase superfamily)